MMTHFWYNRVGSFESFQNIRWKHFSESSGELNNCNSTTSQCDHRFFEKNIRTSLACYGSVLMLPVVSILVKI